MTPCNYCTLKALEQVAAKAGGKVVLVPKAYPGLAPDGVDALIHYPGDRLPTWAAWFMALTDRCVC